LAMWVQLVCNRTRPVPTEITGVNLFAHGADYHCIESLRETVQLLDNGYKIEFAFARADPLTIEHALRKLEQRGAKAAVIVSAYATRNSFRSEIEHLIGMDIEDYQAEQNTGSDTHGGHSKHGHGGHGDPAK